MTTTTTDLLEAARALAPLIRSRMSQMETDRRLPPELAQAMAEVGLFRSMLPTSLGGLEMNLIPALHVFETVAQVDGSAGWCAMIGATGGTTSAFLTEEVAREIYASDPNVVTAGAIAPNGTAQPTDGGYRVTGRWPFNSGCQHSQWLMGTSVVIENDEPRTLPNGYPETRMMIFPASDVDILDTWSVSGLRGSGSHDIAVQDVFVPEERAVLRSRQTLPVRATVCLSSFWTAGYQRCQRCNWHGPWSYRHLYRAGTNKTFDRQPSLD